MIPNDPISPRSDIVRTYKDRTPGSAQLAAVAKTIFPSGVTHDNRIAAPYGISVSRAKGSRKWDVDGNEYVDFAGGHGSLILGHNNDDVISAAQDAMLLGTHFGANHPGEIRWAELIQEMVPSAERVRFFSSGTEATLMALRLARAYTRKDMVIRFRHHFHGWHDHVAFGASTHLDASAPPGVLDAIAGNTLIFDTDSTDEIAECLETRTDIAAVIIEPTGSTFGQVPLPPGFVQELRRLTEDHGVVLIFDEVVSGFRVSPGGAQSALGILPDLTCLAKILGGGFPAAAIGGKKEILGQLDTDAAARGNRERIAHFGTFNANPVAAAAGTKTLEIIRDHDVCDRATRQASALRNGLNGVLRKHSVPWAFYGDYSGFHLFMNVTKRTVDPLAFDPLSVGSAELKAQSSIAPKLRLALLNNGVDVNGRISGTVSAAHSDDDINQVVHGFERALHALECEDAAALC